MERLRGFTLIELVAVIVIVSIGFLMVGKLMATSAKSVESAIQMQKVVQVGQSCAEVLLKTKRTPSLGYTNVVANFATLCSGVGYDGYTATVATPTTVAAGTGACPTGATCSNFTINVSSASGGSGSFTLMLVQ